MNKTIGNTSDVEVHEEDVIVLGVASVETKGGGASGEMNGESAGSGISNE